jgi:hypothetical protein
MPAYNALGVSISLCRFVETGDLGDRGRVELFSIQQHDLTIERPEPLCQVMQPFNRRRAVEILWCRPHPADARNRARDNRRSVVATASRRIESRSAHHASGVGGSDTD